MKCAVTFRELVLFSMFFLIAFTRLHHLWGILKIGSDLSVRRLGDAAVLKDYDELERAARDCAL